MQLKAIFSVLLKDWTFEAAQAPETYRNDHSKMVVQLAQPCRVTVRRRHAEPAGAAPVHAAEGTTVSAGASTSTRTDGWRIAVDRDLCQGHAVCEGEAPSLFSVSKKGDLTILDERPRHDARAAAEQAVRFCPTHALSIVDDDTDDDTDPTTDPTTDNGAD
jgi:sterol 14-demethylase